MFDTMTGTKIVGGFCGTFLVFLLGGWAAEGLYHVGPEGHGEEHQQAYTIAVADSNADAAPAEPVDVNELMQTADASAGEKVFAKCKACHKIDNTNGTGPHLNGVYGRDIASVADFSYSSELQSLDGSWDAEKLFHFLHNPKEYAPGTKMGFAGLPKEKDRVNVIAYLESIS